MLPTCPAKNRNAPNVKQDYGEPKKKATNKSIQHALLPKLLRHQRGARFEERLAFLMT